MTNPLLQLKALGQSVWLDDIDRGQLRSGLFGRLIDEDGLSGATGNPTIFEHAITHSSTYDEQMQHSLREGKSAQEIYEALEGKAAIANARLAYQEFKRLFSGPRFAALKQRGAHVQRPLWASTGTKNPAYRDVLYVEELIGPDTVNTMPLTTIESFREHGKVRLSIEDQLSEAKTQLAALADVGIHYDQVTRQLQDEGVQKFADSFHTLFQCINNKGLSSP